MKRIPIYLFSLIFIIQCSNGSSSNDLTYDGGDISYGALADSIADRFIPDYGSSDIKDTNDLLDITKDTGSGPDVEFICKYPSADASCLEDTTCIRLYFTEESEKMNLKEKVLGIRLASLDLDNDNYPDLIVHRVNSNTRDDLTKTPPWYQKRLLLNRIKENRGFIDFTLESGYGQTRGDGSSLIRAANFAIGADVDNNGTLDLFSGTYTDLSPNANPKDPGDRSEILLNDGEGHFVLAPPSDIFREGATVTSATFTDFDRDGNIDLFVGAFYKRWGFLESHSDRLYRGDGKGNFVDVTEQMGLLTPDDEGYEEGYSSTPTYGVTSCDINGDGIPELMTSTYGRQWNKFWLFSGDKYTEIGRDINYAGDANLNYSDNEFYKCYCKMHPDDPVYCPSTIGGPRIQCSGEYWAFGIDDQPFRLNGNTFTTICADVNNDGNPDIIHTEIRHWHIGQSSDPTQLLKNTITNNKYSFSFERLDNDSIGFKRQWGITDWNEGDISGAVFDFNNDGLPDIFIASSDYPGNRAFLFMQKTDHTFVEVAQITGIAHKQSQEVTVADFDRDGDLDIIVGSSTARNTDWNDNYLYFYRNNASNDTNAIEIKLIGANGKSNRSAIGAKVKVKSGDVVQYKEIQGGYGHFGLQNDLVLHFGLNDRCVVDEITIVWPNKNNTIQTFKNIYANYLIEIEQEKELRYIMPLK